MKKQKIVALTLVLALCALASTVSNAETVIVPLGQQGEKSVERPPKGTNKAQVEAVYGEPLSKHGPVGKPPIYHWEYPGYTVYFEGDFVLHTVLKAREDVAPAEPDSD